MLFVQKMSDVWRKNVRCMANLLIIKLFKYMCYA